MGRLQLTSERLRLEPLTEDHTELLVALDADPQVVRHVFGRPLGRDEVVRDFLPKRLDPAYDARGLGFWAGFEGASFAGWWCLIPDPPVASAVSAELGYRLARSAWGRGLATEGARALLAHGFGEAGLERVWATTMVVNTGSQRVLEKCGLRQTGPVHEEWPWPVAGGELGGWGYEVSRGAGGTRN